MIQFSCWFPFQCWHHDADILEEHNASTFKVKTRRIRMPSCYTVMRRITTFWSTAYMTVVP